MATLLQVQFIALFVMIIDREWYFLLSHVFVETKYICKSEKSLKYIMKLLGD